MIHKETREEHVVVKKHKVVVAITCDLCKRRFDGADSKEDEVSWPKEDGERETIVKYTQADYYHGSADVEETAFHICSDCFVKRLVPWLKEQGAEPTHHHTSW